MSLAKLSPSTRTAKHADENGPSPQGFEKTRPKFNSNLTSDRLRDDFMLRPLPFPMIGNIKKGRKSVFIEEGLGGDRDDHGAEDVSTQQHSVSRAPSQRSRRDDEALGTERRGDEQVASTHNVLRDRGRDTKQPSKTPHGGRVGGRKASWYSKLGPRRPQVKTAATAPSSPVSGLHRFTMLVLVVALVFPGLSLRKGGNNIDQGVADAGVIRIRETSPTEVCTRWAHQGECCLTDRLRVVG